MSDLEKILQLVQKNDGYITTKEVVENNLNKMALKRLCDGGMLERISTGYYTLHNMINDDYYKIISKSKNAIFSYTTALFLHDLSDRTPFYFDMTVPVGYNGSLSKDKNVVLHYVKKENIKLGLVEIESPFGMKLRCYDRERTICDIIKYKNHMDREIFVKALKRYSNSKQKDLVKLIRYAKKLNIEKKVIEYMEVLL